MPKRTDTTPVEIVTDSLCEAGIAEARDEVMDEARGALADLCAAGWRIVRTDDCANPDAGIGQCGCYETLITEEWAP